VDKSPETPASFNEPIFIYRLLMKDKNEPNKVLTEQLSLQFTVQIAFNTDNSFSAEKNYS